MSFKSSFSSYSRLISILLITLSLGGLITVAQNRDIPANTVTLFVSAPDEESIGTLEALLDAIQTRLIPYELTLDITTDFESDFLFSLYASSLQREHITLTIFTERPDFDLTHSHLLREDYGFPIITPSFSVSTLEPAIEVLVGMIFYMRGDCETAITIFDDFVHIQVFLRPPFNIAVLNFYRSVCALKAGNLEIAQTYLEKNEPFHSSTAMLTGGIINLAWIHLQFGRDNEAFALLDQYVAAQKNNRSKRHNATADAYAIRAQFHALNFDYDSAIADVNQALDVLRRENFYPPPPMEYLADFYILRGQMILLTYEWDAVARDYTFAMHLAPDYAPTYYHRGVLYYTQGPKTQALADFQRYLTLSPDGEFAESARKYVESIEIELEALGG